MLSDLKLVFFTGSSELAAAWTPRVDPDIEPIDQSRAEVRIQGEKHRYRSPKKLKARQRRRELDRAAIHRRSYCLIRFRSGTAGSRGGGQLTRGGVDSDWIGSYKQSLLSLEEAWTDLVGGVVLLGLVDLEVLAVEGLAELAEEVAAAGGELVLHHQVATVTQHLHHRAPDPVEPPHGGLVGHQPRRHLRLRRPPARLASSALLRFLVRLRARRLSRAEAYRLRLPPGGAGPEEGDVALAPRRTSGALESVEWVWEGSGPGGPRYPDAREEASLPSRMHGAATVRVVERLELWMTRGPLYDSTRGSSCGLRLGHRTVIF